MDTPAQLSSGASLLGGAPFRLAEYGFQANALQTYREDGQSYITVFRNGQAESVPVTVNTLLRRDDWREIDRATIEVRRNRLQFVEDLRGAGLVRNLADLGITMVEFERMGDMGPARLDMSVVSRGDEDTLDFDYGATPVPIAHKGFRIDQRRLLASRRNGEGLDTTQTEIATRKVVELWEDLALNGSSLRFRGEQIYGPTTHPDRNVFTVSDWTNAGTRDPVGDVLKAIGFAHDARFYGDYNLYLSPAFWNVLLEDFKESSDRTLLERIEAIRGIKKVAVLDALKGKSLLLIQMTRDVIQWAQAQDITPVEWDEQGGLLAHFKILGAGVPIVRSTMEGQSGIVHGTRV